jgi:hypothetical protein
MKKLLLSACIFCSTSIVAAAQHDHSSHQKEQATANPASNPQTSDNHTKKVFAEMFFSYINLKNALIAGDAGSAAANANAFLRTVNTIDFKLISEANLHILANDAGKIAGTKELKKQRAYFASLSSNVVSVAKAFKLTDTPVYVQYCPMQKASWLSTEKNIRNPYFGNNMLTCGEVTETL